METIHKKDGRLHIYVRQDKYKGELKSHNWVGRTYINGKQKVISSGTTNLEEAIPILEKWFDELQLQKIDNIEENPTNPPENQAQQPNNLPTEQPTKEVVKEPSAPKVDEDIQSTKKNVAMGMLDKLKNLKLPNLKGSKNSSNNNQPGQTPQKNKAKELFQKFFQSKVSKMSVAGEEIAGLDITKEAIRVAQVSQDKEENWILDKFSYRLLDQEKITENILESKDYVADEIELAMSNAKITSKNIALSIPVTSAIIRVVTSPLMTDDELQKAIETDSLWENLVQLTDNLNDYSVFHQVINRNSKNNTMEILFVASKLSDVNAY